MKNGCFMLCVLQCFHHASVMSALVFESCHTSNAPYSKATQSYKGYNYLEDQKLSILTLKTTGGGPANICFAAMGSTFDLSSYLRGKWPTAVAIMPKHVQHNMYHTTTASNTQSA